MVPSCADEILAATGGHPLIRGVAEAERGPGWLSDDGRAAVLARVEARGGIGRLIGVGPAGTVATLLRSLRGELPAPVRVNVPRGTGLTFADAMDWNFRAARATPPPRPAEDAVSWCQDTEAITGLLRLTRSAWSTWPGDGKARRWAGLRAGPLLACLADTTAGPGVGTLASVAVHPEARRRALGSSITAWAMRRLFTDGCDVITLGVHPGNTAATRMYDDLGFAVDEARTSGVLEPR